MSNPEPDSSLSEIRREIEAAFSESVYPGDDRIVDGDPKGDEFFEEYQVLRGKLWQDYRQWADKFIRTDVKTSGLTVEALHYYLPGLLLATLDDKCENDAEIAITEVHGSLSPSLARNDGEFAYDNTENFQKFISLLSEPQRAVVIRVLNEYVGRDWLDQSDVDETIRFLNGPGILPPP